MESLRLYNIHSIEKWESSWMYICQVCVILFAGLATHVIHCTRCSERDTKGRQPPHRGFGAVSQNFLSYEDPIIVGLIQGWGANPNMVGRPTHGFAHGFYTQFLGLWFFVDGVLQIQSRELMVFCQWCFLDPTKGTMFMF